MVSEVSQGMGVINGEGDRQRGRGRFGVDMGHLIVTNRDSVV